MKKKTHYLLAIAVLLIGLVLVACATIDSIYFEQQPRTLYVQGQDLDFENTVLSLGCKGSSMVLHDPQSGFQPNTGAFSVVLSDTDTVGNGKL
jgi:hypothetical protein